MNNDQAIEQQIQAKGLNAPRITPAGIVAAIVGETFTVLPSGKVMVCELTLRNGFTVRGESATVSKANFNNEIGQRISRENAQSKVWELEGYLLQERLFTQSASPTTSKFPPHQQRVLDEKQDLDIKASALGRFIEGSPIFSTLDPSEQERLKKQNEVMWQYSEILGARINEFVKVGAA
jgi:hypothetical protein